MTELKRYFSVDYDEEYYIFDSTKISKEEVLENAEYSYDIFGESLMEDDVVNLLNENEQLKKEIDKLKHRHSLLHDVCIEAECDRDRYHKDVVSLEKENEQLTPFLNIARDYNLTLDQLYGVLEETLEEK